MSKRDDILLVNDILNAIGKIKKYSAGYDFDKFLSDDKTIDAIERNFEIIGEASNQFSTDFQKLYPDISWHSLISFRNRLIHGYFGVDLEILWHILQYELQNLEIQFEDILKDLK